MRLPPIPIDGELARRLSTLHSDTQLNYQPRGLDCLSEEIPAFTANDQTPSVPPVFPLIGLATMSNNDCITTCAELP